jgi:transposase
MTNHPDLSLPGATESRWLPQVLVREIWYKVMQRVRQTGSTAPAKIGGYRRPLLEAHADDLRAIVSSKAGITLCEIKAALAARGIAVKALSTIADMLHRLGLSHKNRA